jgi:hypothetical protein
LDANLWKDNLLILLGLTEQKPIKIKEFGGFEPVAWLILAMGKESPQLMFQAVGNEFLAR